MPKRILFLPLASPRGVKGAALAACEEIVVLPGTGSVAGVNEGESTLSVFFLNGRLVTYNIPDLLQVGVIRRVGVIARLQLVQRLNNLGFGR